MSLKNFLFTFIPTLVLFLASGVITHASASHSLDFNGTSSFVEVPDNSSLRMTTTVTLEAWFFPISVPSHKNIAGKNQSYLLSVEPYETGFRAGFELYVNGAWQKIYSSELPFGHWYHLAGAYDGAKMRLFVNGNVAKTLDASGPIRSTTQPFRIGTVLKSGDYFGDRIDEVRVSNNARYISNFQRPTTEFTSDSPTRGLWHFTEGTGTRASDSSTYNNHGTLINSPLWSPNDPFDTAYQPITMGSISPFKNLPLVPVHMGLMRTGEILTFDAFEKPIAYSKVWNIATNTFTEVSVGAGIFCSGHSFAPDGRLIVMGGHVAGKAGINQINIFDPSTRQWARGVDMAYPRWYPSVLTLSDGNLFVFSGEITSGVFADRPEIYNPVTNTIRKLENTDTSAVRETDYSFIYVVSSGDLFVISGYTGKAFKIDHVTEKMSAVNTLPFLNGSAVMYQPGKFLYSGGGAATGSPSIKNTTVLDINTGSTWKNTAPMKYERYLHNLKVLPDGKVLAIGGAKILNKTTQQKGSLPLEMWDPSTQTWSTMSMLFHPRMYHSTSLLLPDGRVLIAGGGSASEAINYDTAEFYSPPYLFKGARPTISQAPDQVGIKASFTVGTPQAADITKVVLMRLGSVTHSFDTEQRYVELSFTKGSGNLTVSGPETPELAPPGHYMLFILNSKGVPSVAKILKVQLPSGVQASSFSPA